MEDALAGFPDNRAALQDDPDDPDPSPETQMEGGAPQVQETQPSPDSTNTFRERVFEPTDVTQMDWLIRTFSKISRDFVQAQKSHEITAGPDGRTLR